MIPTPCRSWRRASAAVLALVLTSGAAALGQRPATPRRHVLAPSPATVAWGYYWSEAKPVLHIASGDQVVVGTLLTSTPSRLEGAGLRPADVEPALRAIVDSVTDKGPGGHILTGPIHVDGAEPGDVLEVRIEQIALALPYAYNAFGKTSGFIPEDYPYAKMRIIPLDRTAMMARFAPGIDIPLRPFFGSIGVAPPPAMGRVSSAPPGVHAGNLDNKELVAGTTLYIPVHVRGALLAFGDGHAGQGDGEVDITGLETSLTGTFTIVVRKDLKLTWPRGETPTHWIAMGADRDLVVATRTAVRQAIDFLVRAQGLSADDAYMLTSVASDVRITQLVDGNVGAHVMIPKSIFTAARARTAAKPYDVILRRGTIVDGQGTPRFTADVAIAGDRIARIGDLSAARGTLELDVRGLMVAPGFINLHSHAVGGGLATAANMLTQGVTTELVNSDGGAPLDLAGQLAGYRAAGLAVNVGGYLPFNSAWEAIMGQADRRPTSAQVDSMRALVLHGLAQGAFGVASGLDYKPAYFAAVDEVVRVLEPTRRWRTNFTNHDRLTPETGFSSRLGMGETMDIGVRAGLVPVFTHMKIQGHEQGSAPQVLDWMRENAAKGQYATADIYPYLAGQTALYALIIPGWAQEGGNAAMVARFKEPALRERIVREGDAAITARFGGAKGVYLYETNRELTDVMREMRVTSPAEAVVRILEQASPGVILRFGAESDVVMLLQHPSTSVACDCDALPPASGEPRGGHPRYWGTFPRVLGHYVRETRALTWEEAVRKMTGLPAATIGMTDRGVLAVGMMADLVVFDSATVIDHATFAQPDAPSDGIRHVFVNGVPAVRDGAVTHMRAGRPLTRVGSTPSRPMILDSMVRVRAGARVTFAEGAHMLTLDVTRGARARATTGRVQLTDSRGARVMTATALGTVQVGDGWAAVTGWARGGPPGTERAFTLTLDTAGDAPPGMARVTLEMDEMPRWTGTMPASALTIRTEARRPAR